MDERVRLTGAERSGAVLLFGGIAALGSLATQLLVPALPMVARDLGAGPADAQLVIGVFLVAMGGGQLACGPLADRHGRRPVLMTGLALFCLGSLLAALAPSLPLLLAGRVGQALGAAAGIVTVRVMLADLFPPAEVAAAQATLMAVVLASPMLAPVVGGLLAEWLGWRGVLGVLTAAGVAGTALALWRLPAPTAATPHPRAGLLPAWRELLGNRRFLTGTAATASASSGLYMFIGFAPFLLEHHYALAPRETGLCLMLVAAASIGGTRLVRPVERRGDALLAGALFAMAGAGLLATLTFFRTGDLAGFLGPMCLVGIGAGMTGPAGITRVLQARPGLEATATSLAGALQMLVSAVAAYALAHAGAVGQPLLAAALLPAAACGLIAALFARCGRTA